MPDLGTYATEVLGAYAVSLGAIAALILWIWARGRRMKAALDEVEARQGKRA